MSNNEIFIHKDRKPEIPEFIIERDDEEKEVQEVPERKLSFFQRHKWLRRFLKALAVVLLVALTIWAYKTWNYYNNIGIDVSTPPSENINKLKTAPAKETAQVVHTSDSILGVELDFYAIHGLRASIEFKEPKLTDKSVYLYCRSADHKGDYTYLGSLVVNGEEKQSDHSRFGYMAMVDDRMVIGVESRREEVKDYVMENGGSYFRQYILVSNRVIPSQFELHGKVERKAIGRMNIGGKERLYFISTRNKETLWDFADALREYGFIDAIYITGGTDYCYYRTADGQRHDIGDINDYPHKKWKGVIPWLVLRKR